MVNFATSETWIAAKLTDTNATTITYNRAGLSVTLSAIVGTTETEEAAFDDSLLRYRSRDYYVNRADLVLNGSAITPMAGDYIEQTLMDETVRFAVTAAGGLPPYELIGQTIVQFLIHTKQVARS